MKLTKSKLVKLVKEVLKEISGTQGGTKQIQRIKSGALPKENNMLKNAPHTSLHISQDEWTHPYSRLEAAYPSEYLKKNKYWPPVGRVDNVYGDRNLMCSCPSMKDFD